MAANASSSGDTTDRLRDDIDSGRTGEKVRWPDPAAAPLGTDDEAAGTPPGPERIAMAREGELRPAAPSAAPRNRIGAAWVQIILVAVLLAGALAVLFAYAG